MWAIIIVNFGAAQYLCVLDPSWSSTSHIVERRMKFRIYFVSLHIEIIVNIALVRSLSRLCSRKSLILILINFDTLTKSSEHSLVLWKTHSDRRSVSLSWVWDCSIFHSEKRAFLLRLCSVRHTKFSWYFSESRVCGVPAIISSRPTVSRAKRSKRKRSRFWSISTRVNNIFYCVSIAISNELDVLTGLTTKLSWERKKVRNFLVDCESRKKFSDENEGIL